MRFFVSSIGSILILEVASCATVLSVVFYASHFVMLATIAGISWLAFRASLKAIARE